MELGALEIHITLGIRHSHEHNKEQFEIVTIKLSINRDTVCSQSIHNGLRTYDQVHMIRHLLRTNKE